MNASQATGAPGTKAQTRQMPTISVDADLVVVGGGLAGTCCAITAAREGLKVALVQDRPVLGGNASSEVRLWVLGATSHMGNNNRWAREGGVIDELLVENIWRNPEGNAVLLDSLLLEFVLREPNIRLLLNTAIDRAECAEDGAIRSVSGFCSQNQTQYALRAPLFCDASGDGVLGFLAGAAFRVGAEARSEFGELLAPEQENQDLLGHSLYFYTRDTGRPVVYVPPAFALQDVEPIVRYRELRVTDSGCRLWWLEYGGSRDTVYETEEIKWELWRVAYGVWNYIKNSGTFPEAECLTLEWMGMIPGKRESRRFEGDVILTQQDLVEQKQFADAVSFGGWAIDLHPAEGVYSPKPGCEQWHAKGVYQIPYRTMYSRNVPNLFLAGRILSASHIAFGSTRVMATCAHNGQAVGMAAAICSESSARPRELVAEDRMRALQQRLLRAGQHIPGVAGGDIAEKARSAVVTASSTFELAELASNGERVSLDHPRAMLLPLTKGEVPAFGLTVYAQRATTLRAELWMSARSGNFTPDVLLSSAEAAVDAGGKGQKVELQFHCELEEDAYGFVMLSTNEDISVAVTDEYLCGVLTLSQRMNGAVAKSAVQQPPEGSGLDTFAFWLPDRRPDARNFAITIDPPLAGFEARNVINGFSRPWQRANVWMPARDDRRPALRLTWAEPQTLGQIEIVFDTDYDHPMESVLMGHPERVMPGCVTSFEVRGEGGELLGEVKENHQTRVRVRFAQAVVTRELSVILLSHGCALPAIYEVRCY